MAFQAAPEIRLQVVATHPEAVTGQGFETAPLNPAIDRVRALQGIVRGEVLSGNEIQLGVDEGVVGIAIVPIGDGGHHREQHGAVIGQDGPDVVERRKFRQERSLVHGFRHVGDSWDPTSVSYQATASGRDGALRPDVDLAVIFGIADEDGQHDSGVGSLDRGDLVDAAGVEEVEVARHEVDAVVFNVVLPGVFVKGICGDVGFDVFRPQAAMQEWPGWPGRPGPRSGSRLRPRTGARTGRPRNRSVFHGA